ncbi:hypothetical protein A9Q99_26040 [Gammaproteobacteria bacterium 45_16_T64]|nr:hypothetical protein A9Q99_26040 [Gammaproteobacteria bacterium 45_16_T64]
MKQLVEKIQDKATLLDYLNHGKRAKYLYFWGHQKNMNGLVEKSCFSQWYSTSFIIDGETYRTAEHYMMAEKAKLFGDNKAREAIVSCRTPGEAKKIGRNVKGFNDNLWKEHRSDIVVTANEAKFSQNESLEEYLLSTGKRVLVEASPVDKIWGVGLAEDNPLIESPYKWRGLNLLGFALMNVRTRLQNSVLEK